MLGGMTPLLELVGVGKTYWPGRGLFRAGRAVEAVRDVSFAVRRGEVMGIVGESGQRQVDVGAADPGLEAPSAGSIRFDGGEMGGLRGAALAQARRRVQMVFQDPGGSLNPRKTAARALGESLALAGVPKEERGAASRALFERIGLAAGLLGHYPHELSGGQRQRLAIARALAVSPGLLVADEPVSALDVSLAAQIMRLLLRLRDELGLTLLFISHDLALVHHLCDRVVVMQAGAIVERGTPAEVLHAPQHAYTRLLIDAVPAGASRVG